MTEILNQSTAARRKPPWIRVKAPTSQGYHETRRLMRAKRLHTVCEEAACPNIGECWQQGHATVMILGDTCTRACAFCNVKTGLPRAVDPEEPRASRRGALRSRPQAHRDHLGRSRRPAGRRRVPVRALHRGDPCELARDHDRDPDARLPAQGRGGREDRRRRSRRLQPQPRDRAAALSHRAAGRALLPLAAPARPGQGAGPRDVHQVRPDGRARRGEARDPSGDGRHALGRRRFSHDRAVPAADAAPSSRWRASSPPRSSRTMRGWRAPRGS